MPNILNLSENDEEFNKNEKNIGLKFGLQISKPHFLFYNDQDDGSKENYEQENEENDANEEKEENEENKKIMKKKKNMKKIKTIRKFYKK